MPSVLHVRSTLPLISLSAVKRELVTSCESSFELFCFEKVEAAAERATSEERRQLLSVGAPRPPSRQVHLSWAGLRNALEDMAKIAYLSGALCVKDNSLSFRVLM